MNQTIVNSLVNNITQVINEELSISNEIKNSSDKLEQFIIDDLKNVHNVSDDITKNFYNKYI